MEKRFEYIGSDVYYEVYGSGKPVVLLHGFAEDNTIWNGQVSFLEQHCLLIIPDLPGSGRSPLLTKEDASIEDYADVVHALLNFENIEKCLLFGHSMGGYITLAFAEKFPGKLAGFGLVHSTAFEDNEEKKKYQEKSDQANRRIWRLSFFKKQHAKPLFSDV